MTQCFGFQNTKDLKKTVDYSLTFSFKYLLYLPLGGSINANKWESVSWSMKKTQKLTATPSTLVKDNRMVKKKKV